MVKTPVKTLVKAFRALPLSTAVDGVAHTRDGRTSVGRNARLGIVFGLLWGHTACSHDATTPPDAATDVASTDTLDTPDLVEETTSSDILSGDVDNVSDVADSAAGPDISDTVSDVADSDDTSTPLELPVEPAVVTTIASDPYLQVVVVSPTTLMLSDAAAWWWLSGPEPLRIAIPEGSDLFLPPTDEAPTAAAIASDEVLVGGPGGLSRIRNGELLGGPLVERFDGNHVSALAIERIAPAVAFWISDDNGLKRWSDGVLQPFTAASIDFGSNLVAFGAPFAPENDPSVAPVTPPAPALWLAGPHGVSALRVSATPPSLGLERPDLAGKVQQLATTREGHLYALTADALHVRLPASGRGQWIEVDLPSAPVLLAANRESAAVWALLADGTLVRGSGTAFARVAPVPAAVASSTSLALHADGRLVAATNDGLYEISASRTVTLGNLPTSGPLRVITTVAVRASDPDAVTSVTATVRVNDAVVATPTVTIDDRGTTRTITLALDPFAISNGNARLTVTVNYVDSDPIVASANFSVDFPTWERDVAGIYSGFCSNCHGPGNGVLASLENPTAWSSRIDDILCRIDAHSAPKAPECETLGFGVASMPPGRTVPSERVEMLRLWREAGFRP